ncbi:MAG: hypothetical protein D6B27_06660 [Gammaproteobacteria bacterium]|nr:MAG: hypothetical protein D6B27_06660 [Gammaproteobacteria bacterium]
MSEINYTEILKTKIPLNSLGSDGFAKLLNKINIDRYSPGRTICNRGEIDGLSNFLISGEVELIDDNNNSQKITADDSKGRFAFAQSQPRKFSVIALTEVVIATIANDFLDILVTWEQSSGMVVEEISPENSMLADDSDWMTKMLHSNIFFKVPPANIQAIFNRMTPVYVSEGETVINQGEQGDYYYIIKRGKAEVIRCDNSGAEYILAQIESGSGFGEEALMSDTKRNASVKMLSSGELMALGKNDFEQLLKEPLIKKVTYEKALQMKSEGIKIVDVRLKEEYENNHIPGSINIPMPLLRLKAKDIDDASIVVCCDTGSRSSAASYILSEDGFDVYVLDGGITSLSV